MNFDTEIAKFTPRQMAAVSALDSGVVKFLLYGGALGGGKSFFLRWYCLRVLLELGRRGFRNVAVMLACEDYTSLKDRQLSKISIEFPSCFGRSLSDHKDFGRCFLLDPQYGAGVICFRNLDDPSKYASAEFALIAVDELTKNPYDVFTHLRTRLRWPGLEDIECQFVAGSNPGSVGHGWVKQLWIDRTLPDEFIRPVDYRPQFAYIPSLASDNPHLTEGYYTSLNTLPTNLRKAFRDGDWNIFLGQAFTEWTPALHIIPPRPIPAHAPLYCTFDWGYGAPFSFGWWWCDADGRGYRFNEWYGWDGSPNQGLRMADADIAAEVVRREVAAGLARYTGETFRYNDQSYPSATWERTILRLAGPDCFSRKPNYMGGGQGPSTAEVFAKFRLFLSKGDPSRELKLRQFRERLRIPKDSDGNIAGVPMLQVYNTCSQFIRTIPSLVMDTNNIEDIDTNGEDHVFDESAHFAMARPMKLELPKQYKSVAATRIDALDQVDANEESVILAEIEQVQAARQMRYADEMEFLDQFLERPSADMVYDDLGDRR